MKQKSTSLLILLTSIFSFSLSVQAQAGELRPATGTLQITSVNALDSASDDRAKPASGLELESGQDLYPASVIVTYDSSLDAAQLAAFTGGRVVHQYQNVFRGASLVMLPAQVDTLANLSGVTGIYQDEVIKIDTEHSPAFIGAPAVWEQLGRQGNAGEGVVVGVIDTGIDYNHPDLAANVWTNPGEIPGNAIDECSGY